MKRLLFLVAVAAAITACVPAYAAEFAAENNAGGHIVLTEEACPVKDAPEDVRGAFTYSARGDVTFGCWTLAGERVVVIWLDDGRVAEYAAALFRKVDGNLAGGRGA